MSQYILSAKNVELFDDFNGSALDTTIWIQSGVGVVVADSELRLTTDLAPSSKGISSAASIDLTGQYCSFELASVPANLTSLQIFLRCFSDSTHRVQWALSQGVLYVNTNTGSGDVTPPGGSTGFNPESHRFLRIREESGTVFWEFSADGVGWSAFYSSVSSIPLTGITVSVSADTYYTETAQAVVSLDKVTVGADVDLLVTVL